MFLFSSSQPHGPLSQAVAGELIVSSDKKRFTNLLVHTNASRPQSPNSISSRRRERGSSKANAFVSRIKDRVKALKESQTIDKIKPFATGRTEVIYNEINKAGGAADGGIQRAWPDLGVCCEGVSNLTYLSSS